MKSSSKLSAVALASLLAFTVGCTGESDRSGSVTDGTEGSATTDSTTTTTSQVETTDQTADREPASAVHATPTPASR